MAEFQALVRRHNSSRVLASTRCSRPAKINARRWSRKMRDPKSESPAQRKLRQLCTKTCCGCGLVRVPYPFSRIYDLFGVSYPLRFGYWTKAKSARRLEAGLKLAWRFPFQNATDIPLAVQDPDDAQDSWRFNVVDAYGFEPFSLATSAARKSNPVREPLTVDRAGVARCFRLRTRGNETRPRLRCAPQGSSETDG